MKHILICGAGIAGPALAYWLQRYGFKVTVVERAPAIRDSGYAVDVRGAALNVLDRMNLLAKARLENTDTLATSFVGPSGKRVATMERGYGVADENDVEIMRGDLARILYEATRDNVTYIFSDSIAAIEERADGVHVSFDRHPPAVFDMLVGADGVHSNVRRHVFGDESQFVQQLGSYMAVFSSPNHLQLDRWQLIYTQPGRVVSIKTARGNADVKVAAFFSSPPITYDYRDIEQQKRLTSAAFDAAGWELPRLLAAIEPAQDFYFDATCLIRMPRWSHGRVTLIGDACVCPSPLSGQGTGLALVGAYVLAGELSDAAGDHETGFANYERTMRPFADRNQAGAEKMARGFAPQTPRAVRMRDFALKLMNYLPGKTLMFKMALREVSESAKAITLRDYSSRADAS